MRRTIITLALAVAATATWAQSIRLWQGGESTRYDISTTPTLPYTAPGATLTVGGTAYGADTACVLTPAYTANLLDTKVHTVLCKPWL